MRLRVEVEGQPTAIDLPGDGAELVALMSFAVSRGFGATHPLIALADRLHDKHHVRWGPLTIFYEAEAEDAEDNEKLEMAWQPAGPLREELVKLAAAIAADEQSQTLVRRAAAEAVPAQATALAAALEPAIAEGRRVRLVYDL
ncbi:MAG TPA: hypothetical protein PKD27_11770 [Tepidiformaceae bacterium]|nr:hypothetical protein [Tepidiformaceae bacterium]